MSGLAKVVDLRASRVRPVRDAETTRRGLDCGGASGAGLALGASGFGDSAAAGGTAGLAAAGGVCPLPQPGQRGIPTGAACLGAGAVGAQDRRQGQC